MRTAPGARCRVFGGSAVLAGGALGLNRDVDGKAAGMRTHAIVSLGPAVAVLAGVLIVEGTTRVDGESITRTVHGVIPASGFIGAGAILDGTGRGGVRG